MDNNYNIVLTSSGFNSINNYVSDEIIELFKQISKNKRIMILSNAAPESSGNYIARENVKENFLNIGAKQVDIVDLNKDNLDVIFDYDIIYGLGGNLQFLIELNETTNFKEKLIKFLKKGLYIGESAGSMILANSVKWAFDLKRGTKPKYDVELDSYDGLGLTDYIIYPHWNKADEEMIKKSKQLEKTYNLKLTRLNDGEFIKIRY